MFLLGLVGDLPIHDLRMHDILIRPNRVLFKTYMRTDENIQIRGHYARVSHCAVAFSVLQYTEQKYICRCTLNTFWHTMCKTESDDFGLAETCA